MKEMISVKVSCRGQLQVSCTHHSKASTFFCTRTWSSDSSRTDTGQVSSNRTWVGTSNAKQSLSICLSDLAYLAISITQPGYELPPLLSTREVCQIYAVTGGTRRLNTHSSLTEEGLKHGRITLYPLSYNLPAWHPGRCCRGNLID